jgi:hypothetical protein
MENPAMKRATQQTIVALTALLLTPLAVLHAADAPAVINLRQAPYSAAADGKADDRPALAAAFSAAKKGDTIFVPAGDYRFVLPQGTRLSMPEGVTLVGEKGLSRFVLVSDGDGKGHREFLLPGSSSVIQGVHFSKEGTFPAVLFPLVEERDGIVFRDCVFDGGSEKFPSPYCHCFQVGGGTLKNLVLERIVLREFTFGLFQTNQATGSVEGVRVVQSLFERNTASDLEFNAPSGKMTDITVCDCNFRDNLSKSASGGFAVGFANVKRGNVERCRIEGYGAESLHVEDRSEEILLKGNTIVGGSTIQGNGVILVVNDSRKVTIEGNYVDGRPNGNKPQLILVTAGGNGLPNPSGVLVKDNVLINGEKTTTWYLQPGSGPEPVGNIVVKPDAK